MASKQRNMCIYRTNVSTKQPRQMVVNVMQMNRSWLDTNSWVNTREGPDLPPTIRENRDKRDNIVTSSLQPDQMSAGWSIYLIVKSRILSKFPLIIITNKLWDKWMCVRPKKPEIIFWWQEHFCSKTRFPYKKLQKVCKGISLFV